MAGFARGGLIKWKLTDEEGQQGSKGARQQGWRADSRPLAALLPYII
jgi:hypothetical protein